MSMEAKALTHPPGLGVAMAQARDRMKPEKADAKAGEGEIAKEPCVFPRRRPDITDAEAERHETSPKHPPPRESAME